MIQSGRWLLPGVNVRVLSAKSTNQIIKLLPKLDNLSDFTQAHTVTDGYIEVLFSRKKCWVVYKKPYKQPENGYSEQTIIVWKMFQNF